VATILDPITNTIHDTAAALIDERVPDKIAGAVNGFVTAGFGVITDVLTIVRDLTASSPAPPGPGP